MRIFYAADTTPNSAFQSNIWRYNLMLPLIDLGHDVVEFEYDLTETFRHLNMQNPKIFPFIQQNRPKVSAELVRQINKAHVEKPIDLFFSYFYDACVLPETIDEIKTMGITTVNWFCNGAHQLHLVTEISPHYDWCLVPEKFRLDAYRAMGAHPIYSQEAANPHIYKPYDVPKEFDVTFVGQAYGDRPEYIRRIVDEGIDVRVWGKNWIKYSDQRIPLLDRISRNLFKKKPAISIPSSAIGGILSDEELIHMYSRSNINLGFSSCGSTHMNQERILQVRLRDFEVPMSGGFYMVEFMEELEEFYDIGKEIVCYHAAEDLIDKIHYYLKNESERENIRRAGYERCRRDHTWQRRFEVAFQKMGFDR
jgi:spore maturation protein CgeB